MSHEYLAVTSKVWLMIH